MDGAEIPFLTSPFSLNDSVEKAAPFNVVIHPRCCEPRNESLEKFQPLAGFEPVTARPPELTNLSVYFPSVLSNLFIGLKFGV